MKPQQALFQKVAIAERHVVDGRRIVARQRALISDKAAGRDTFDAEQLLDQFERTLEIFEDDYRAIRAELEKSTRG
jgi:hypothetical protein